MLILQQHLTLVTTINTQGGEKKQAIDRSAWLLLLHCFPGSLSEQWLSSCTSQAGTDPRGCLQSSTRGGRGEQGVRELNAAVKWHWLPARIQNRRLRAKSCWENRSASPPPSPTLKLWEHLYKEGRTRVPENSNSSVGTTSYFWGRIGLQIMMLQGLHFL